MRLADISLIFTFLCLIACAVIAEKAINQRNALEIKSDSLQTRLDYISYGLTHDKTILIQTDSLGLAPDTFVIEIHRKASQ